MENKAYDRNKILTFYTEYQDMLEKGICKPRMALIYPSRVCNHQCAYCQPPGADVLTASGVFPIETITPGTKVWNHLGKLVEVEKLISLDYSADLYEIKVAQCKTKLEHTKDHDELVLQDNKWVKKKTSALQVGDILGIPVPQAFRNKEDAEKELKDIFLKGWLFNGEKELQLHNEGLSYEKIGDVVGKSRQRTWRTTKIYKTFLEKYKDFNFNINEDLLWLFGLYIAEGYTAGKRTTTFALNTEEVEYIEKASRIIKEHFNIEPKISTANPRKTVTLIHIHNNYISRFFARMFGHGCENKHVPEVLLNIKNLDYRALLKGVSDGDGHYRKSQTHIGQTSKTLAYQLRMLAGLYGYSASLYVYSHPIKAKKTVYTVYWSEAEGEVRRPAVDGIIPYTVTEITKRFYEGPVFSLSVPEGRTYISTGGIVTGNCSDEITNAEFNPASKFMPRDKFLGLVPQLKKLGCESIEFCVLPGQKVRTDSGVKTIETIDTEDKVLTRDGLFNKVNKTMNRTYYGDIINISYGKNREILTVTADHKVFILRKNVLDFIKAKEINCTDFVVYPKPRDGKYSEKEIELFKSEEGFGDENFYYLPINSIGKEYFEGTVYNLNIENEHNFIVGTALVSNCGGGESMMHPNIGEFIDLASENEFKLGTLTNGTMLKGPLAEKVIKNFSYVRISLDSLKSDTYDLIRRPKHKMYGLNGVVANIENLVRLKKELNSKCLITLKACFTNVTISEIEHFILTATNLGVDGINIKVAKNAGVDLLPKQVSYYSKILKMYKDKFNKDPKMPHIFGGFEDSKLEIDKCLACAFHIFIDTDGSLMHCCYYQNRPEKHTYGNAFEQSLDEIWYSEKHIQAIKEIDPKECNLYNCKYHGYNNILKELIEDDKGQLQFT